MPCAHAGVGTRHTRSSWALRTRRPRVVTGAVIIDGPGMLSRGACPRRGPQSTPITQTHCADGGTHDDHDRGAALPRRCTGARPRPAAPATRLPAARARPAGVVRVAARPGRGGVRRRRAHRAGGVDPVDRRADRPRPDPAQRAHGARRHRGRRARPRLLHAGTSARATARSGASRRCSPPSPGRCSGWSWRTTSTCSTSSGSSRPSCRSCSSATTPSARPTAGPR